MKTCSALLRPLRTAAIFAVVSQAHAGPYVDAVLLDDPVAYWRLEEGSGIAVDSATGGSNGQGSQDGVYSDPAPLTIPGPIRSEDPNFPEFNQGNPTSNVALDFTGIEAYVEIADDLGVMSTFVDPNFGGNPWTMEYWLFNANGGSPLVKGTDCCTTFHEHVGGTHIRFGILSGDQPGATGRALSFEHNPKGVWNHVVTVISGHGSGGFVEQTDARVYLDGQLLPDTDVLFNAVPDEDSDLGSEPITIGVTQLNGGFFDHFFDGVIDEVAIYNYALDDPGGSGARDNSRIMAHFQAAQAPPAPDPGSWVAGGPGNWNLPSNWFDQVIPNANDATAILGDLVSGPTTIFSETAVTVNTLNITNSDEEYVIMGNGSLNFDAQSGSNASINLEGGDHRIQLPVDLAAPLDATTAVNTSLAFENTVDLGGNDLNESGPGELIFNSDVITGGGVINMSGGSLSGSGSIDGDVTVSDGALSVELTGEGYDGLTVLGTARLDGSVDISLVAGYAPTVGDTFDVLTASSIIDQGLSLRGESDGFSMDVVASAVGSESLQLTFMGAAIPEPAAGIMACLAVFALGVIRRRGSQAAICLLLATCLWSALPAPTRAQTPYQDAVLADNPVGYWRFEETDVSPGMIAADTASNNKGNNFGIYEGDAADSIQRILGAIGDEPSNQAISINPVDNDSDVSGYVRVDDERSFEGVDERFTGGALAATSFTFEAWLNPMFSGDTDPAMEACCGNYMVRGFFFAPPALGATFGQQRQGGINGGVLGIEPANAGPIRANEWTHVVVTFEADAGNTETTQTIYYNGELAPELGIPDGGGDGTNPFTRTGVAKDTTGMGIQIGGLAFGGRPVPKAPDNPYREMDQGFHGGIDDVAYYDYVLPPDRIAAHFEAAGFIVPEAGEWISGNSGSWHSAGNWQRESGIPDGNDRTARFGSFIVQRRSVFTSTDVTVKGITFENEHEYVIGGNGDVILDSDTGSAFVDVRKGSHQIQSGATLMDPTTVTVDQADDVLSIAKMNLNGQTLTKEGAGRLNINNNENVGGGSLLLNDGTLGGVGEVGGSLMASAGTTVAPGKSTGMLSVETNYMQDADATLEIEIGGTLKGEQYDVLNVSQNLDAGGGTLQVVLDNFTPTEGDLFDILDFGSISNSFTLDLPGGIDWDSSQLLITGILSVGVVNGDIPGDYDDDGAVAAGDLNLVLFNWGEDGAGLPAEWINERPEGNVGVDELNPVLFNWGNMASAASVPEPTAIVLLALGSVLLWWLRS